MFEGSEQLAQLPLTIQTSQSSTDTASAPSQMSPNTAKKKCKNFLSTLILLAKDQPDHVASNVKNMVQGIIDGVIEPEDFATQLHKELNSSPQPCLVPFLKKSLPYLRYSLMNKEITIEGVRPPALGSVTLPPAPAPIQLPQGQTIVQQSGGQLRFFTPGGGALAAQLAGPSMLTSQRMTTPNRHGKTLVTVPIMAAKQQQNKPKIFTLGGDNEDLNDVVTMGGISLLDENQRLLISNVGQVGPRIRNFKDTTFLIAESLKRKISAIAKKHEIEEPSPEIASLLSHSTQEYLKDFLEKLAIISEHRLENNRADTRYEIAQDVKSQLKFLEELDKMEKKRHEENEREHLLKAAKSRSKPDDPEQLKLKQKAKDMQRAEMEEIRHRDANQTALLAIGNRKRIKLDGSLGMSQMGGLSGLSSTPKPQIRPRIKRVSLKDLLFLMEQDKRFHRSTTLYKSYLKYQRQQL